MASPPKRKSDIEHRVKDLDRIVTRIENQIGFTRKKAPPTTLIIAVLTPVLVFLILFCARPTFVMKPAPVSKVLLPPVRDQAKLAQYTVLISVGVYALIGGAKYFAGQPKKSG